MLNTADRVPRPFTLPSSVAFSYGSPLIALHVLSFPEVLTATWKLHCSKDPIKMPDTEISFLQSYMSVLPRDCLSPSGHSSTPKVLPKQTPSSFLWPVLSWAWLIQLYWNDCCLVHPCYYIMYCLHFSGNSGAKPPSLLASEVFTKVFPNFSQFLATIFMSYKLICQITFVNTECGSFAISHLNFITGNTTETFQ